MTLAKVDIYNMALGEAGIDVAVASPTENSLEAETCGRFYDTIRKYVLSAGHWPSCRRAARLGLLATKDDTSSWTLGDPEPGWKYSYALPSDYLHARYEAEYDIFQLSAYEASNNDRYKALVSNKQYFVLVYTRDEDDVSLWDPTLQLSIVYALAAHITLPLTGKKNAYQLLAEKANMLIEEARTVAVNAEEYNLETLPPWIAARGSTYQPSVNQKFVWPYGPKLQTNVPITVS